MKLWTISRYAAVSFIIVWSIAPIYWTLRTSLVLPTDLTSMPPKYFPWPLSMGNYDRLFGLSSVGSGFGSGQDVIWQVFERSLINSLVVSVATTVLVGVIAIFCGYVFSRLAFRGSNSVFGLTMATMALPAYAVLIPLYRLMSSVGWIDTYQGLTLIYVSAFAPIAVWLMRSYYASIPLELDDAAYIDGASRLRVILTVLPSALPGVIGIAVLTFLASWSQFLIPLVFSPTMATKPATVVISEFVGKYATDYGLMTAAAMITMIPPVVIVLFLNRYLVSGLATGSVKT